MAVFRVEKNRNYTVMSNFHLRDTGLSLKAIGLLSKMLSLTDEWDYTTRGLAMICKEGVDAIGAALRELEKHGYLVRNKCRDSKGRITDTEYIIYEQPYQTVPDTIDPDTEKPFLDNPDTKNPAQLNKDKSKTDKSMPESSNPDPSGVIEDAGERIEQIGYETAKKMVQENIEADILQEQYGKERINEVVELMAEMLCSHKQMVNIAGNDYPASMVRDRLMQITSAHVEYVFDCLDRNPIPIRNIKKYLLTTLFNAPSTMDNYYAALVSQNRNNPK